MKRKAIIEVYTDDSGEFCLPDCPHGIGFYCDVFNESTPKVPGTCGKAYRCRKCKDAEHDEGL